MFADVSLDFDLTYPDGVQDFVDSDEDWESSYDGSAYASAYVSDGAEAIGSYAMSFHYAEIDNSSNYAEDDLSGYR